MTTGRINQVAFLTDEPAPNGPRAKSGTTVVRTKRRTLVFSWQTGAIGPHHARWVFRIRENEHPAVHRPPTQRPGANGERGTTGTSRPTPRRIPQGTHRKAGTIHVVTANCLRDRYATQETNVGRVEDRLKPLTTEEASTGRRRCSSRDPTCPRRPTATHAPFRTECPVTQAPNRPPQRPWASRG